MKQAAPFELDPQEWERRKRASVRMAWRLALVAVALFALAIWKYRPL